MPLYKKLISVIVSSLILFSAGLTTVTAVEGNAEALNTENTAETITIMTGVITEPGANKIGVRVRADAGTGNITVITTLSDGTAVSVLGTKNDVNNNVNPATQQFYVWYNIQYQTTTGIITGYVREDMITVTAHTITPPDQDTEITVKPFEEQLAEFPESYHSYLTALHQQYPNWIFTADNIDLTYQEAIAIENIFPYKLVENQYYSWRSMENGAYNWNTGAYAVTDGRWYGASREVIAYYMDPRNFLNANDAYIFMKQSYDEKTQSIAGVRELLKGRFMENNYNDPNDPTYGGDFAAVIMEAARQAGINPYILASIIIQEQGTNGSSFAHGVEYQLSDGSKVMVYNYFNFGVSGTTEADKIQNGAAYAYNAGWTTRSAAIIGGAKKYSDGYVNSSPNNPYYNQDTYFYKNYNILNPSKIYHQYAQNVADQVSSAAILRNRYSTNFTTYLTFRIPVYKNNSLPETPLSIPAKNMNMNNYYFNTIEVVGLTPSFSRYVYNYSLQVSADTSVYVEKPETAEIISPMTYNLTAGDNAVTLTVKSATGYINNYIINVNALNDCVLTVITERPTTPPPSGDGGEGGETPDPDNPDNPGGGTTPDPDNPGSDGGDDNPDDITPPPQPIVKKGDANGDGVITVSDLAAIRLHILEISFLSNDNITAADTNLDGKISVSDLAAIRLHMLGIVEIK